MFVSHPQQCRRIQKGLAASAFILSSIVVATSAFAQCGVVGPEKWAAYTGNESTEAVLGPRFQTRCALVVDTASGHFATDDNPALEQAMYGYFWIYTADATVATGDTVTVYQLVNDNGTTATPQMSVLLQGSASGTQLVVQAANNGNTATSTAIPISNSAPFNGWHEVQFSYVQGSGNGSASVTLDRDGSATLSNLSNATITDARLGSIVSTGSPTGQLRFDAYLSQRVPEVDLLQLCNAQPANPAINAGDAIAVLNEVRLGSYPDDLNELATPNCDGGPAVNSGDAVRILGIVRGSVPNPNL